MRVLCLHGQGASATIFETQLSRLMASLPPHWTFEFVDAPIDCGPGLDIGQVYPGPYYCFFESYTPDRMHDAVEYVREIVEDEGPFDAIIGFSQGASVAATYLSTYAHDSSDASSFAFAVFICTALIPPALASKSDKLEETVGSLIGTSGLPLPTVHVIGTKDPCLGQSVKLLESCYGKGGPLGSESSSANSTPPESNGLVSYFPPGLAQAVYFPGGHDMPRNPSMTAKVRTAVENAARIAFLG